jgi:hypothetical protein
MNKAIANRIWMLAAISLLVWPSGSRLLPQGDALIVPGVGVGVLRIGESITYIREDLAGQELSNSRLVEVGPKKEMWLSYKDIGLTFIFSFGSRILDRIIGCRRIDVLKYFKGPPREEANELDFPKLGIKFVLNSNGTVVAIEVKRRA